MTFTASRMAVARKRRALTLTNLADLTGFSTRSLSAFENGHKEPSEDTVRLLAEALGVRLSFLQDDDIDEIPVDLVSFRAISKMTARQRDSALGAGRVAVLLNDWIESRFNLPRADLPTFTGREPEAAAEEVRARWGLGEKPIINMLHLLEAQGVRVYSLTGENSHLDAYSLYWRTQPFIFLSTTKSGERGRFDAAHELGHLVLHGEHRVPHASDAEQEANRFAAAFLMPRGSVLAAGLRNATVTKILHAKRRWNVAAMALTHRLNELDLLTEWGYRSCCVQLSRMGYRRGEPAGIQRESSQLLCKVFRALREEGIGPARISEDIGVSPNELRSHIFGLTLTSV
jgi:Zn-dependent peptidase ImmA (M78 family)/DNA-binding XRE family transcriptional regulator